jgi:hypothetical protein
MLYTNKFLLLSRNWHRVSTRSTGFVKDLEKLSCNGSISGIRRIRGKPSYTACTHAGDGDRTDIALSRSRGEPGERSLRKKNSADLLRTDQLNAYTKTLTDSIYNKRACRVDFDQNFQCSLRHAARR